MNLFHKIQSKYQRSMASYCFRRLVKMRNRVPLISFTFDDFPRSALHLGGGILNRFGLRGTYYASLGLAGTRAPTGQLFDEEDLPELFAQGHELGCHTFSHCHSWDSKPSVFEESVRKNASALKQKVTGAVFRTMSYPLCCPRPFTKRRMGKHFSCCRGGGQKLNVGIADLNYIAAYFLEKSRGDLALVRQLIDSNSRENGWLVLATHDVDPTPTTYGCTPEFFAAVVEYAAQSGAEVLPVTEAVTFLTLKR